MQRSRSIVTDTNLWISFLISKDLSKLDEIIFSKKCILIFSNELIFEFIEVANRPEFKRFFPLEKLTDLFEAIKGHIELVSVKTTVYDCSDSKDNFLLSLAIDSKSDYLITGDRDLLILNPYRKTAIVTIAVFY